MSAVGVIDYMGVVTAVARHIHEITPRYRSIIVDEAQDFGSVELSIIRKLVAADKNDLFLCGDAAQHILPKHQSFEAAGIDVKGRSSRIVRNYRNSREILRLAHQVLTQNLSESHFEQGELEISDPELSYRSGAEPLLLEADSLSAEIAAAIRLLDAAEPLTLAASPSWVIPGSRFSSTGARSAYQCSTGRRNSSTGPGFFPTWSRQRAMNSTRW
jgi:superfamily I DNA/RNA helicase